MEAIIATVLLITVGITIGSIRVTNQGYQALVERLGRYNRTLKPGLNLMVPFLETIVWEETTREQILDIEPQEAITKDNVSLKVDAVIYWQLLNMEKAYYAIDNVKNAIENLVLTNLRSQIGEMQLEDTYTSRDKINKELLEHIDEVTQNWGVKVKRVEVRDIKPPQKVLESMAEQRAAEIRKRASILDAEGTAEYMKKISEVLQKDPKAQKVLEFFLAQKYVDANVKLSESPNSKILFMNPKVLNEALAELMKSESNVKNNPESDEES